MAGFKNIAVLMLLFAGLTVCLCQVSQGGTHEPQGGSNRNQRPPHESQGGPHQNQGRVRRQAAQAPANHPEWTTCDFTVPSKISCHDCNTRLICKAVGGLLKPCDLKKPYCNNGICSVVPSPECA